MWSDMTPERQAETLDNMTIYGGSFVNSLAFAWRLADEANAKRLADAFPDLVARYAPVDPAQ